MTLGVDIKAFHQNFKTPFTCFMLPKDNRIIMKRSNYLKVWGYITSPSQGFPIGFLPFGLTKRKLEEIRKQNVPNRRVQRKKKILARMPQD